MMLNRGKVTHTSIQTLVDVMMEFLEKFSELEPCVLSRSIAQVLYLGTGGGGGNTGGGEEDNKLWGGQTMAETLREAAKQFICPPALMPKAPVMSNPQAKAYVDNFFTQCVRPFEQLLQMSGHNRARQRDKVTELLREFALLQDEVSGGC
ncbi:hypothetical protein HAZT_HAZT008357 [Hyalella azteca]|uniref:Protein MAK10 homolog n=1 Tax=Hyalella azteca TaxID=294128 RepID=A0A6A0HBA9_HYAAZ|nr:hypothetical protein HAZT_HAZT008357 [Hyalella azteca]